MAHDDPLITVVLTTPTGYPTLRRTLASLAGQTIADRIEVLVVAPSEAAMAGSERFAGAFESYRVLPHGPIDNVDRAAAPALLEARAEIVSSIEDHAFPEPDWAEEILKVWARDERTVAVGSAVLNANPQTLLSWSNIVLAYGEWTAWTPEGEIGWVAMHNASYRTAALVPHRSSFDVLFNREADIMRRLAADGGRFLFAPKARVRHLNPSNLPSTAQLRMDAARLLADNRARDGGWGKARRAAYVALSPAIPGLRYLKLRRDLFAPGRLSEVRQGPALLVGLLFDAAGQALGFGLGPGGARDRLATFEMDRLQHLCARDRASFAPLEVAGAR